MYPEQRLLLKVFLFIYFPSILCFFVASAIGLHGEFFFGLSPAETKLITLIGLSVGWIGTFMLAQTITNVTKKQGWEPGWRVLIVMIFCFGMLVLSFNTWNIFF